MNFLSYLYTLIISPLELLFENIFMIANRMIGNEGLSIIFLSLAVNLLVLPLYKRADELQAEERNIQLKMAPWIKHIKKTFSGDERFFMLQEYYRINHYKPVYALKSSVSVMLQIPFFIAAYNMLSGMQSIKGMQFGFIPDLGKEDALISIGSFPVNVLPILMTTINIVSGIIYTKGHPLKEKIQVYGLAAVFLILLYRSPSGLVFYWLLNNVFSLIKNIFYKLPNPKKAFYITLAFSGSVILVSSLIRSDLDARQKVLLSIGSILLMVPFVSGFLKIRSKTVRENANTGSFFAGAIFMALLTGLVVPSSVINDSVFEFIDNFQVANPVLYIVYSMLLSFGSWVLWSGVFYFFMNQNVRSVFCKAIWIIGGISIVDYMLFGKNLGNLSSTLQYDIEPAFTISDLFINSLVVIVISIIMGVIFSKFRNISKTILIIGVLVVACLGINNTAGIMGSYSGYMNYTKIQSGKPSIPLNKNGKNVIVLMLDRGMGTQVPYILNEKPELKEKFDGFTYYPNTISFGPSTIVGSPALCGGYEYTPESINARSSEMMMDKHNQALKVMPVLFSNNGYKVTVCDPPYAGYLLTPDLSIYDDYPSFNLYTSSGALDYLDKDNNTTSSVYVMERVNGIRRRNLFCFSLMKISPLLIQNTIYDGGLYNEPVSASENTEDSTSAFSLNQKFQTISKSTGYNLAFLNPYAVISNLSKITEISDSSENTFLFFENDTTHYPNLLQEPDYEPSARVDNTAYDTDLNSRYTLNGVSMQMSTPNQICHYHVNMAAFLKLGEWFDYLRENGVYDNTRIIIVADHGRNLGQFGITCNGKDMEAFMPLLMVKDFNAKGFTTSEDFMTNADTPYLAAAGIIDSPANPFTGKPLYTNEKSKPQNILLTNAWSPDDLKETSFPAGSWFTVKGDPHKAENWKYIGDH